jgi:hypothetical protein
MYASQGRKSICPQREEKTGEEINWEWTVMSIGKINFFPWSPFLVTSFIFGD